jgi:hypothetical protein
LRIIGGVSHPVATYSKTRTQPQPQLIADISIKLFIESYIHQHHKTLTLPPYKLTPTPLRTFYTDQASPSAPEISNKDLLGNAFTTQRIQRSSLMMGSKFTEMSKDSEATHEPTRTNPDKETASAQAGNSESGNAVGGGSDSDKGGAGGGTGSKQDQSQENETSSEKPGKAYDFERYIWGLY